jgi:uncharacterized protein YggE
MRLLRRFALAGVLLALAPATEAADGIKASATASRDVPADVVNVSFQISERAVPADGAADERSILTMALEEKGLKILERSARYEAGAFDSSYDGSLYDAITGTGTARASVNVQKHVILRVTGFKHVDDVLDILRRHAVRQRVVVTPDHSHAEVVLQELQKEAIESAIAQARRLAEHAGAKSGGVVDLVTQRESAGFCNNPSLNLIDPPRVGELPLLRFSVIANVVLSVKAE